MSRLESDYGLLNTVREVLSEHTILKEMKVHHSIHFTLPHSPKYPLVLLELDEIWNDYTASSTEAVAKINFRISMMSPMQAGQKSLEISSVIEHIVNGKSMRLSPRYLANFRKTGNIIDLPMMKTPRTVQQHYQSMIWCKSLEEMH